MSATITLTPDEIERLQDEYAHWDIEDELLENPTLTNHFADYEFSEESIRYDLLDILSNPDNFHLTCKLLLNIRITPTQQVVLKELYTKPYQTMIASRGFSKCVNGDTWVVAEDGFKQIKDIVDPNIQPHVNDYKTNLKLRGENGFVPVEYSYSNGRTETLKIKTSCGYNLEGTKNHPIRVVRDGEIKWVNLEDVKIGDYCPIHRSTDWFPNTNNLTEDEGYMMGMILGNGGYTVRGRISFTTADIELADELSRITTKLWNKPLKKLKAKYAYYFHSVDVWDELFQKYGFNSPVCGEKDIPSSIMGAPKKVAAAFIRGLADTDGCFNNSMSSVQFAAKSENLMKNLQFLLTRFGIISTLTKKLNKTYDRYYYYLNIFGANNKIFRDEIGFGLKRKQEKLEAYCQKPSNPNKDVLPHDLTLGALLRLTSKYKSSNVLGGHGNSPIRNKTSAYKLKTYQSSYEILNFILDLCKDYSDDEDYKFLSEVSNNHYFYDKVTSIEASENITYDVYIPEDHSFVSNGFISHNSFNLAILIILKCIFEPNTKIAIIGVGLRQSKNLFEYVKRIWENAPLLRQMANRDDGPAARQDRFIFKFCTSQASFLPLGSGSGIRGERASIIIIDEYGDVPKSVIDTVVIGFAAVSKDPEQKQLLTARIKRAKRKGIGAKELKAIEDLVDGANAILLAGTAKPYFNHFAQEWERRKKIILSRGDPNVLKTLRSEKGAQHTNHEHYSIIRIPYDLIPEGFMSDETVALAESSLNSLLYNQEYMACFPRDTNGFFPASLIYQQCTADQDIFYNNELVTEPFPPMLIGDPSKQYILGVDPARTTDNAALVLLELNETHTRVVYCWSTNQKQYDNLLEKTGNPDLGTYYQYIAAHILELMNRFNIIMISMDSQAGGREIANILAIDQAVLQGRTPLYPLNGDSPIWNVKRLETDDLSVKHIIELVTHSAQYTSESHHGLLSDLEKMKLFFPQHDAVSLSIIEANFKAATGGDLDFTNDPMTVCMNEINELKYEMTIIEYTTVGDSGRERWDTPEVKKDGDKKGRLRNDRESALVMANYAARRLRDKLPGFQYNSVVTYVGAPRKTGAKTEERWQSAPDWFVRDTKNVSVIRII